ncbi:MAG TPA: hypothetical protein VEK08_24340 [Planctomycetota bacterium]|nr:hypothetical protein [Planctomycetota bacterium]
MSKPERQLFILKAKRDLLITQLCDSTTTGQRLALLERVRELGREIEYMETVLCRTQVEVES